MFIDHLDFICDVSKSLPHFWGCVVHLFKIVSLELLKNSESEPFFNLWLFTCLILLSDKQLFSFLLRINSTIFFFMVRTLCVLF